MLTLTLLLAQAFFQGWSVGSIAIAVIVAAAIIAVVFVVLKQLDIPIPSWVLTLFWICVCAFIGVIAVKFLMSL